MSHAAGPQIDEDAWVVPAEWQVRLAVGRGVGEARPITSKAKGSELDRFLIDSGSSQFGIENPRWRFEKTAEAGAADIAAAGNAVFDSPEGHTPLGVAAVVLARFISPYNADLPKTDRIADALVDRYGLAFAVSTVVYLSAFRSPWWRAELGWLHPDAESTEVTFLALARIRAHLAAAEEADYRGIVEQLAALRRERACRSVDIATSYLAPTEQQWVDADLAAHGPAQLLAASVTTDAQRAAFADAVWPQQHQDLLAEDRIRWFSAIIQVGPALAPVVGRGLTDHYATKSDQHEYAEILAAVPTDEAFLLLLGHIGNPPIRSALHSAAQRFPRRAMRLLTAVESPSAAVRFLLHCHARAHPDLAAEFGIEIETAPLATEAQLPELLRTPPWERSAQRGKPVVLTGLRAPIPTTCAWLPGEQEQWATLPISDYRHEDWAADLAHAAARSHEAGLTLLLAQAPHELALPYLRTARPGNLWNVDDAARRILGRFGDEAIDYLLSAVAATPALSELLLPLSGTAITSTMLQLQQRARTRPVARAWFRRHLDTATTDLVVAALAKPGKDRTLAENQLRVLADRGYRASILAAAADLGEPVAAAITGILDSDRLLELPKKIPALPVWLTPSALPQIVLRANNCALPADAAATMCTMLAMSGPTFDYPGVEVVAALAEPATLAEFAWGIFEQWRFADYPAKENWALHALGLLGDDETARRLTPLIGVWPGEGAHTRAVAALDVLSAIGTDVALLQLSRISEKAKFKGLKTKAREKVSEVAAELGLTAEELADRMIPDFGLDADGRLRLDYGPRAFVIGFDEQLKPTVADADGAARKSLPKPGAKDDPELATAAYKAFSTLKKDVRTAATDQIRRFEVAMITGRRWSPEDHHRLFVEHPLLGHLTRRLVWTAFDADGAVTKSFRVAEDGTRADSGDDLAVLHPGALIGIAHPLHLTTELGAWGEVFADYEILQPFPQLQRETHTLTTAELGAKTLDRFHGLPVPTGRALGMTKYGWDRQPPQDAGVSNHIFRPIGAAGSVVADLDPGIPVGMVHELGDQKITSVHLTPTGHEGSWATDVHRRFGELDPVSASELLRELHILTA
ncbi:DUF4132 domain-containing protein [Nocardia sp. NPDC051832]|uniref:DUF4132 domain-containing protein n=1 Tax=Nocardia sp. NPDC051832 TaxID=3155673 RepID=UPI0034491ECF